jgi:hypothetical protein
LFVLGCGIIFQAQRYFVHFKSMVSACVIHFNLRADSPQNLEVISSQRKVSLQTQFSTPTYFWKILLTVLLLRIVATFSAAKKSKKGHVIVVSRDETLASKLLLLVALVISYLAIWTTLKLPQPRLVKTGEGQKFYICQESWINYTIFIGQSIRSRIIDS